MYEKYWSLKEKPFQNTPDPRFFYNSFEHEEALTKILYTITEHLGAAMLTGVFGCGKTIISNILHDRLPAENYKVAFINNPQLEYTELLRAIVRHLKTVDLPTKKTELSTDYMLEILGNIVENNARDRKNTVVVIDEAHVINDERIFEELRLLLNFNARDRVLLTLLLFGQPELRQKVEDNKQLEQRIALKCHLDAFRAEDTRQYISHRLRVAEGKASLFDEGALDLIHTRSGGIPRRINQICDISLFVGMCKEAKSVNEEIVKEGLQTLEG